MPSPIFPPEVRFSLFRNCCSITVATVIKIFFPHSNEKRNLSLPFIHDIVCTKNTYSSRLYEHVIYSKLKNLRFVYINLKHVLLVLRFFTHTKTLRGSSTLMLLKAIKQLSRKDFYPFIVKFPDQTFEHLSKEHIFVSPWGVHSSTRYTRKLNCHAKKLGIHLCSVQSNNVM